MIWDPIFLPQEVCIPENVPGSLAPACSYCDASCFLWAQRLALAGLALEEGEAAPMGEQHLGLKYFVVYMKFQIQYDYLTPQIVVYPVLGADPLEGPEVLGRGTLKAKSSEEETI